MNFWLAFGSGLFIGFFLGMGMMCLLIIAKSADRQMEKIANDKPLPNPAVSGVDE